MSDKTKKSKFKAVCSYEWRKRVQGPLNITRNYRRISLLKPFIPNRRHLGQFLLIFIYSFIVYIGFLSPVLRSLFSFRGINNLFENHQSWCPEVPKLDPFDKPMSLSVQIPERPSCSDNYDLLFNSSLNGTVHPIITLKEFENQSIQSCCYKIIQMNLGTFDLEADDRFGYSKRCYPLFLDRESEIPEDHEFIAIYCKYLKERTEQKRIKKSGVVTLKEYKVHYEQESLISMIPFVHPPQSFQENGEDEESAPEKNEKMNVLIIGIDGISHMNFIRTFQKTHEYLIWNMEALEMNYYNKVGDTTFSNLIPMFMGKSEAEIDSTCGINKNYDTCGLILKSFKERGYVTGFAEDSSETSIFNFGRDGFTKKPPADHYLRHFALAAYRKLEEFDKMMCQGPQTSYSNLLDYTKKFVWAMEESKRNYFHLMWSSTLTSNGEMNNGFWADPEMVEMLKWLHTGDYFKNTVLILMSDRGGDENIEESLQGRAEERLPPMYLVLPKVFQEMHPDAFENMQRNMERLVTTYDLYETLLDILDHTKIERKVSGLSYLDHLPRGISLFDPIPSTRTCSDAWISPAYCSCAKVTPVELTSDILSFGVDLAIAEINKELLKAPSCMQLDSNGVTSASRVEPSSENEGTWKETYLIRFKSDPGEGEFETVVTRHNKTMVELSGPIKSVNNNGSRSYCVDEIEFKKFCFCRPEKSHENRFY